MLPDYHDAPAAGLDLVGRYYSVTVYCVTVKPDSPLSLAAVAALLRSTRPVRDPLDVLEAKIRGGRESEMGSAAEE